MGYAAVFILVGKALLWIASEEVKWVNHHEDLFVFEDLAYDSCLLNIKG